MLLLVMIRLHKLLLSVLLLAVIVSGLSLPVSAPANAKIAVEGPTAVGVSTEFTVDVWIRDLPVPMVQFNTRIEWDPSMMEYVSHVSHVTENGWTPLFFSQLPGLIILEAEGPPFSQDASWITVTFHCLRSGISELVIEESGISSEDPSIPFERINLEVNQVAPVGGVTAPINKLEMLTPYIALAGLIIAVSAIVIKKRK
jgi:hypothetical protein